MRQDDETVAKLLNERRPEAVDLDALITAFAGHSCRSEPNLFIMLLCTMAALARTQHRKFTKALVLLNLGPPDYLVDEESREQWFHLIGQGENVGMTEFQDNALASFGTLERSHFDQNVLMHVRPWQKG